MRAGRGQPGRQGHLSVGSDKPAGDRPPPLQRPTHFAPLQRSVRKVNFPRCASAFDNMCIFCSAPSGRPHRSGLKMLASLRPY